MQNSRLFILAVSLSIAVIPEGASAQSLDMSSPLRCQYSSQGLIDHDSTLSEPSTLNSAPRSEDYRLAQAREYRRRGDLDDASNEYEEIYNSNPHNSEVLHEWGVVLAELGSMRLDNTLIQQAIALY
jgi:Tfp pilus assembly protein PilF